MARTAPKLTLSPSRDIPFDRLVLSQANVRRTRTGVSIAELADHIARRGLLQSLAVRALPAAQGADSDRFEVPAGGRRYRALELLVKQKRMAKDALVPCIVKPADSPIAAEEDSYAENVHREALHPLDQFRAMQTLVEQGEAVEAIAARFMTTAAVVRQRLKLAAVSPRLHAIYAEDGMTLDQLMAFSVADDHARQEQVWDMLAHSHNRSPAYIRMRLTEGHVRVADKRLRFVTLDAYLAAGGGVLRDLFEPDDGGWLTDPALLDALVDEKLVAEAAKVAAEGWKWVTTAIDLPWDAANGMRSIPCETVAMTPQEAAAAEALQDEAAAIEAQWRDAHDVPEEVHARLDAIDAELRRLADRPLIFAPGDIAIAGAFVSIARDGSVSVDRGHVRPEDEPVLPDVAAGGEDGPMSGDGAADGRAGATGAGGAPDAVGTPDSGEAADEEDSDGLRPLPDRLVADLTAWRTLALQDAFARDPATAYLAALHALVLAAFYGTSRASCLQLSLQPAGFGPGPDGLADSEPARAIASRSAQWKARLPFCEEELWAVLAGMDTDDRAALFAHCLSAGVNARQEVLPRYDNGRVSAQGLARRIAHSHLLADAVGLDPVRAGWRPTVEGYFRSVTKPRILADVGEARGPRFAEMIAHLKKPDMAREAERLLEDAGWLPEPMRTPPRDAVADAGSVPAAHDLPAFLDDAASSDAVLGDESEGGGEATDVADDGADGGADGNGGERDDEPNADPRAGVCEPGADETDSLEEPLSIAAE